MINVKEDKQRVTEQINEMQKYLQDRSSPELKNRVDHLKVRLGCLETFEELGLEEFCETEPSETKVPFWNLKERNAFRGYVQAKKAIRDRGHSLDVWAWTSSKGTYARLFCAGSIEAYLRLESIRSG